MKIKEELNSLKLEVETLNAKFAELTEKELKEVAGGSGGGMQMAPESKPVELPVDHPND